MNWNPKAFSSASPAVDRSTLPAWCATPRRQATIVGLAAAVVLLTNLGTAPLWDDDEPKNTACSVSMLVQGDWVVPRFNEALRSDKPPLVNWIQFAGFAVLGVNEAGARIGSAALTIATSLLVAGIASRLFPSLPAVGLWSGLAMGTCVWSAVAGRAATPDAGLCFFTTLALWLFVASTFRDGETGARGQPRLGWAACLTTGAALGGAVLAKGPVGLVLPMAGFGVFAFWQAAGAAVSAWKGTRPLGMVAAAIVIAAPWYALVWHRTDGEWIHAFLLTHNVDRFAAAMEGHGGPPFYYLVVLALGLFPWSIVAALTIADAVISVRRGHDDMPLRLLASWAAVWVGCFSLSGTKLPGYIWPAYPAAAITTGWFLERWRLGLTSISDRWMRGAWIVLAVAGLIVAAALSTVGGQLGGGCLWLALVGMVLVAAACLAWRNQSLGDRGASLGWVATAGCLSVALLAAIGADLAGRGTGVRPLVAITSEVDGMPDGRGASTAWGSYGCSVPGLVFYSGSAQRGSTVPRLATPDEARSFFAAHPRGCVVAPVAAYEELLEAAPKGHRVLGRSKSLTRHRELVVIGPAADRKQASLAGRSEERGSWQ